MTLVGGSRIAHKLGKTRVPGNGANLMGGATGLCQSARGGLAQPVRGAVGQASDVTLIAEPVTKRRSLERPAESCRQECQVAARCRCDDGREFWVHRDREFDAGLLLRDI
jgi:hypothetical protein